MAFLRLEHFSAFVANWRNKADNLRAIAAEARELERLAPLVEEGGFVPFCDHYIPADVTLDKYRFYLKKKREIFGIPQRVEKDRDFWDEVLINQ